MSEEDKKIELNDDELKKVSGGIDVGRYDYCHLAPRRWTKALYSTSKKEECGTCIYNPNRGWAQSTCDYPNEH